MIDGFRVGKALCSTNTVIRGIVGENVVVVVVSVTSGVVAGVVDGVVDVVVVVGATGVGVRTGVFCEIGRDGDCVGVFCGMGDCVGNLVVGDSVGNLEGDFVG